MGNAAVLTGFGCWLMVTSYSLFVNSYLLKDFQMKKNIRVLIARLGMDAHWRGSIVVARALRDAGMEVVYVGNQLPDAIVETAIQEDADVIGLSSLSGNHTVLAPEVLRLLDGRGVSDKAVVLGGTVPPNEVRELKAAGIRAVFGPGTPLRDIVRTISGLVSDVSPEAAEAAKPVAVA
jgi:methylmalonyl-CoA mutase C-terminal domain/subunit